MTTTEAKENTMPKRKTTKTDAPYRLKQNRGTWYAVDKKTR
jgi:hypothetical protein